MKRSLPGHVLVIVQFTGILVAVYPLAPQGSPAWLALCAAGAALGLSALWFNRPGNFSVYPEIVPGAKLVTEGPYRYVRHPMYTALMLMMLGIAFYNTHVVNYLGCLAVIVAVTLKAAREERLLCAAFAEYPQYMQSTGRFLPGLR